MMQTTESWRDCERILAPGLARGYKFWPVPNTPGAGEPYAVLVYDRAGLQLDTATGATWRAACWAALGVVERDMARRAA